MFKPLFTLALSSALLLSACGGGGTPAPVPKTKTVTVSVNIAEATIIPDVGPMDLESVTLQIPSTGRVEVSFTGVGTLRPFRHLLLLASSDTSKSGGFQSVTLKESGPFVHKRVYNVGAGSKTIYAEA